MKPFRSHPRRRGFTLVELLVVILIIGILAMLLFPVFKGAVEAANTAKCAGNLRHMYLAAGAYAGDNNGDTPPINNNGPDWCFQLAMVCSPATNANTSMTNCQKLFACPSSPNARYTSNKKNPPNQQWPWVCDYGVNTFAHNITTNSPGSRRPDGSCYLLKLGGGNHPAKTPYIQDVVFASGFGGFTTPAATNNTDPILAINSNNGSPVGIFSMRHKGGGNILWFDGHVSYMKYNDYRHYCQTLANTKTTENDQYAMSIAMGQASPYGLGASSGW